MALERKYERDIDIFLAEEFSVSPSFASWFLAQTKAFAGINASVTDVFVSKADNAGESDLIVVYKRADDEKSFALLIEDKIDAPFQPDQASRYDLRAKAELRRDKEAIYSAYEVLLCAPQIYLEVHADKAQEFTTKISYEQIARFLREKDAPSARDLYRAHFIGTAAKKTLSNYQPKYSSETDRFWKAIYELATQDFPMLEMKKVRLVSGSNWITFRPHGMPSQPKMINVNIKGSLGVVDLSFSKTLNALFQPLVRPLLEQSMTAHQTGASASIRIATIPFRTSEATEVAVTKARCSLEAAVCLIRFYAQHKDVLIDAATKSPLAGS